VRLFPFISSARRIPLARPSSCRLFTQHMDYDNLKKSTRTVETDISRAFEALSSTDAISPTSLNQLEQLLTQFSETLDALELASKSHPAGSLLAAQKRLERHREVLRDYQHRLRLLSNKAYETTQRATLLGTRNDETRHRGKQGHDMDASVTERLLQERGRVDHAHILMDMATETAAEVQHDLRSQHTLLERSQRTMLDLRDRLPGMDQLMQRIRVRRKRDMWIMAMVIATFTILWILYAMRR